MSAAPNDSASTAFEVANATGGDAAALNAFFERVQQPCHCRYWHFAGDKNAWLERLFHAPGTNAAELTADLAVPELHGVVARDPGSGDVVGWMKLTPAERVGKLYAQRLYKGLPCFAGDRAGVMTIGCFLVDPAHRRRGVARALLRAGIELARERGARVIEAFPRRAELLGDEECWLGPFSLFTAEGFEVVHDFGPYPVLRQSLG